MTYEDEGAFLAAVGKGSLDEINSSDAPSVVSALSGSTPELAAAVLGHIARNTDLMLKLLDQAENAYKLSVGANAEGAAAVHRACQDVRDWIKQVSTGHDMSDELVRELASLMRHTLDVDERTQAASQEFIKTMNRSRQIETGAKAAVFVITLAAQLALVARGSGSFRPPKL